MTEPVVKVTGLTYYYPGESEPALRDVNLEVLPGEFVLIIGASGCGKSTLALALNGIIPHEMEGRIGGHVYINGQDTRQSTVYALATSIGIVFQDPDSQLCSLYVEDEVAFGPANLMMAPAEIMGRVTHSLEAVGESGIRRKLIYEISGGQKQRVAIASILAMEPRILLFDEPTANLDPLGAVKVFELMRRLNQDLGFTVIVIEHNVDSVMSLASRLVLMDGGSVISSGPTRAVIQREGRRITSQLGLRIPQISELALRLADQQIVLDPFPLTVAEAADALQRLAGRLKFAPLPPSPAPVAAAPIIETQHLTFDYPDGTHAVRAVSLQIYPGEVIGLVGKNGSGKSTLTSLWMGLNQPSSGQGRVAGCSLGQTTTQALAAQVGYVFQYPEHQFVTEAVGAEVAFSLKAKKRPAAEVEERVQNMLALFGLEKQRHKHPLRLSMGQKRRLSVATMLVLDPAVLILDEPTTGQDKKNIDNIMDILLRINQQGTTIVLVTHDLNLVARYCTRLLVMDHGEMVFQGTPREYGAAFDSIRSDALVLPDVYAVGRALRLRGLPVPEVLTADELLASLKVTHAAL
ncbi:MAG: ABC transporter ATP-binding protein [Anaerolineales bacterium]|nr:ABC transporter ATP-binding protein [Anaerolineales bacterium]